MKVFLSWSGEPSRSVASALGRWLRRVIQSVEIWMSDETIPGGSRWNEEIAHALATADVGIVCLTRSNQHAPWLMFEAGSLAGRLNSSRLVPLNIDIPPSEVTGPLEHLQGRALDQDGVRRLVHDLNDASGKPIDPGVLDESFDRWWPDLEAVIPAGWAETPAPRDPIGEQRKQLLLNALQGKDPWRYLDTLRRVVGQSEQETRDLLVEIGARASTRPAARESWGLISRVGQP